MAIAVGFSRNEAGVPVMLEKAQPDSEIFYGQDGPSAVEEARRNGWFVDGPDAQINAPTRLYSHSSADLK
jgi:hypothetical protein